MDSYDVVLIDDEILDQIKSKPPWHRAITGYATEEPEINMKAPYTYFAIAHQNQIRKSGLLKHPEDHPPLIQYYYVNEILKHLNKRISKK